MTWVAVADASDVPPGAAITCVVNQREIALFNVGGTFYAVDNTCPHQGGPLAEGYVEGNTVTCPWHAWCFDLRSGRMTLGEYAAIDVFDVRTEGSVVSIAVEPRE